MLITSSEILDDVIIDDLNDLKDSIEEAIEGENKLEMLGSLNIAAKETINEASKLINQEAAKLIK